MHTFTSGPLLFQLKTKCFLQIVICMSLFRNTYLTKLARQQGRQAANVLIGETKVDYFKGYINFLL